MANPWQCPACKTFYAPHVDRCECAKVVEPELSPFELDPRWPGHVPTPMPIVPCPVWPDHPLKMPSVPPFRVTCGDAVFNGPTLLDELRGGAHYQ